MKCIRCKTQDILPIDVFTIDKEVHEESYYCENCGATYKLIDDSGG